MSATPQDVYDHVEELRVAVEWLARLVVALVVITVLKIAANVVIDWRVTRILRRVVQLLDLTEQHGKMTDEKAERITEATHRAARDVVLEVQHTAKEIKTVVPAKVVEEIRKDAEASAASQSGTNLGTLPPSS